MLLFLVEDTFVCISFLGPLLHGNALFVVLHILAKSFSLTLDLSLSSGLVNSGLTSCIFKTDFQSFLSQVVFGGDRFDLCVFSLSEAEFSLNVGEKF